MILYNFEKSVLISNMASYFYKKARLLTLFPVLLLLVEQVIWASNVVTIKHGRTSSSSSEFLHWGAYQQPLLHKTHPSPVNRLPVTQSGQAALPSNASNFHGGWNTSVDKRTGAASFSMVAAGMLFDNGQSKRELALSWAGSSVPTGPDRFGLGAQWQWNTGTEHPSISEVKGHMTTDISLGDGHSFTMVSDRGLSGKTIWRPLRHKLKDVIITGQPGNWTIAMATGIREHIYQGYEDWEETRDGKRVWFYYDRNGFHDSTRHLIYICGHPIAHPQPGDEKDQCEHQGIKLNYHEHSVIVHGQQKITIYLGKDGGVIHPATINIPSMTTGSSQPDRIDFTYDNETNKPWLIHSVHYPTGIITTFLYNEESTNKKARTQGLSTGIYGGKIPVVTELITRFSRSEIPERHIWYYYGNAHNDQHNYTGYQGNSANVPGKDNLFDRADSYLYKVTQDNGYIRSTITYNKYHLPLGETQQDDQTNRIISKNRHHYLPWRHTVYQQLPPEYSLPVRSYSLLYGLGKGTSHSMRTEQAWKYNSDGQLLWHRDIYGRETFIQYCPSQGNDHCPIIDPAWPQMTAPEKILTTPARQSLNEIRPFSKGVAVDTNATEYIFDYNHTASKSGHRSYSRLWQVTRKTVMTLPLKRIADITPGKPLPEANPDWISTQTEYHYSTANNAIDYGKPTQFIITKYPVLRHSPATRKLALSSKQFIHAPESITIDVHHKMDVPQGLRSTSISYHEGRYNQLPLSTKNPDTISMDTSEYSIVTGVRVSHYDALKTLTYRWKYDSWKRPLKMVVTPSSGGRPQTTTWRYTVNEQENTVITTYPNGLQKKTVMGANNEIISTWHRFRSNSPVSFKQKELWIPDRAYSYTTAGKIKTMTEWHAMDHKNGQASQFVKLQTSFGYDVLNRLVWKKYPTGQIDFIIHDDPDMKVIQFQGFSVKEKNPTKPKFGPLMEVMRSNLLGNIAAFYLFPLNSSAMKSGQPLYTKKLKFEIDSIKSAFNTSGTLSVNDCSNMLLSTRSKIINFVNHAITAKAWLTHTSTDYDGMGRRILQKKGNGATTRWIWERGELVASVTPDGRLIHDNFNVRGQKTDRCVKTPAYNNCHTLGVRHFNSKGKLVWQQDQKGNLINYTYDADGRLLSVKIPGTENHPKGHLFTYHYNSLGVTSMELDGIQQVKYTYDPTSWRVTDKEDHISHIHYTYDDKYGTLVKIIRTRPVTLLAASGVSYPEGQWSFTYDPYLKVTSKTDFTGNIYTSKHDEYGRVTDTYVQNGTNGEKILLTSKTYDSFNRTATIKNGIGIKRSFIWNNLGQLRTVNDEKNSNMVQRFNYTYDPDTGNITRLERASPDARSTRTFQYDIQNNLTDMECVDSGHSPYGSLCPRETALAGSGLTAPPIITSQHYTFDGWNNIKTVREMLKDLHGQHFRKTVSYTYAHSKNGTAISGAFDPHRMTGFQEQWSTQPYNNRPHTIAYDNLGRIVVDADGNRLEYNAFGQQSRFTNVRTGETTRYTYDSAGRQVAEQPFNSKGEALQPPLYMIYAGNHVMAQIQKDRHGDSHVAMEMGGIAHSEDGVINRWYLHNYKGDVTSIFNGQGRLVSSMVYSPYGMAFNRIEGKKHESPVKGLDNQSLWWQSRKPGFNGEMSDPATGYQFLGGGYRAYNPVYRHFMARDSYSPFTKIDGYGFGGNNPVMNTDPSGHLGRTSVYLIGISTMLLSASLAVLTPLSLLGVMATATTSSSLSTGTIGASTAISVINSVFLGACGVASGSLQIESARHSHPKRSFAIANDSMGLLSALTIGGFDILAIATFVGGWIANANKLINSIILLNGALGLVAPASAALYNGLHLGGTLDKNLSKNSGFKAALDIFGYAAIASMTLSTIAGIASIGAIAKTGWNIYRFRGRMPRRSIRQALETPEYESQHSEFIEEFEQDPPEQLTLEASIKEDSPTPSLKLPEITVTRASSKSISVPQSESSLGSGAEITPEGSQTEINWFATSSEIVIKEPTPHPGMPEVGSPPSPSSSSILFEDDAPVMTVTNGFHESSPNPDEPGGYFEPLIVGPDIDDIYML